MYRIYRLKQGEAERIMNVALWIVQGVVAVIFLMAGFMKAFNAEQARTMDQMAWINDLPAGLVTFIGISEMLGGLGAILPAITGVLPWLTPLAAALLGVVMLLAAIFHLTRGEYQSIAVNLVLLALAAFVVYGRFMLVTL